MGSVMFGRYNRATHQEEYATKELVRLALPRRVYTQSHINFIVEKTHQVAPIFKDLPGYRIDYQSEFLRHFTARFSAIPLNSKRK